MLYDGGMQTQGDGRGPMDADNLKIDEGFPSLQGLFRCFGLLLFLVSNDLILREPAVFLNGLGAEAYSLALFRVFMNTAFILALLVGGAYSLAKKRELDVQRLFVFQVALGAVFLLTAIGVFCDPLPSTLLYAMGVSMGLFAGIGLLCWVRILSVVTIKHAWLEVIVALFASALGYAFFLYAAETIPVAPFFGALYLLSVFATGLLSRGLDERPIEVDSQKGGFGGVVKRNYATILCIAALNFVLTASRSSLSLASDSFVNTMCVIGILFSAVALFAVSATKRFGLGMTSVYRISFPVIALAFLMLPFMSEPIRGAFMLVATLFGTMGSTVLFLISFSEKQRSGLPATGLYGVSSGFMHAFLLVGLVVQFGEVDAASTDLMRYTVVASLLVYAFLMLFVLSLRKGDRRKGAHGIVFVGTEGAFREQCESIAMRFSLTQREREVMEMIMLENGVGAIADKLGISANTVRTHNKNLYRKIDIHTKAELLEMLSEEVVAEDR